MVTWGSNTVHTFGSLGSSGVAPATPALGAPAGAAPTGFSFSSASSSPAPSFTFGSTPATTPPPTTSGFSFGSPAPAQSGGFSFSNTTGAPALPGGAGGGLFGAPAPTPGGLFGQAPPPPPGASIFGTPSSGSLFGAPAPSSGSLFGNPAGVAPPVSPFGGPPPPQQMRQTQIPAQAALQAHMDASARQEQARIESSLSNIHQNYIGTQPATEKSSHFVSILYNQATPEYQQLQALHGMWVVQSSSEQGQQPMRRPVAPPRPPQVSERDWEQAVVRNPDHTHCMPVALVGADALQGRLGSQQERANSIADQLKALEECRDAILQRYEAVKTQIEAAQQRHIRQRQKLSDIMQRVEIFRCYNNPLQTDEIKAMQKATDLHQNVDRLSSSMHSLQQQAAKEKESTDSTGLEIGGLPNDAELKAVLTEHREELSKLVAAVKQDTRDLHLIQQRIDAITAPRIAVPSRV